MNPALTREELDWIYMLYKAVPYRRIIYHPWAELIKGDAVQACSIIAPLLRASDTIVSKVTVGSKKLTVEYIYKTVGSGDVSIMKPAKASFRYDRIGDERLWQYLLLKKYPVPLFFGVGHPLNGENVISLGLATTY